GISPPRSRGSTRRSRGRGRHLSPAQSGEYPAKPGEGGGISPPRSRGRGPSLPRAAGGGPGTAGGGASLTRAVVGVPGGAGGGGRHLSPAQSGEYPAKPGEGAASLSRAVGGVPGEAGGGGGISPPRSRTAQSGEYPAKPGRGRLSPAHSGEYPAKPGEGVSFTRAVVGVLGEAGGGGVSHPRTRGSARLTRGE